MKIKFAIIAACLLVTINTWAQDEEEVKEKGFKKENLFSGGSVTASFFSRGFILGANPMFGYKLNDYVDGGVVINYTYASNKDYIYLNDKLKQSVYGGGVFARVYPVKMIFLQGQFEHNFVRQNYTFGSSVQKFKNDANSLLVGAGFAQGREKGSVNFFYFSLLFDVLKNRNSPYVDNVYDNSNGAYLRTDAVPIIRAGINIGLFKGSY